MGKRYLLDTNVISKYLNDKLDVNTTNLLEFVSPELSIISKIELLSWTNYSTEELSVIHEFISDSIVHDLNGIIVNQTIDIRKKYKIKLPDAIIAATAITNNLVLISFDSGFKNIKNLKYVNPLHS